MRAVAAGSAGAGHLQTGALKKMKSSSPSSAARQPSSRKFRARDGLSDCPVPIWMIQQPDNEQEQHHDRADIDDNLQEADGDGVLGHEKDGQIDQHERSKRGAQWMDCAGDDAERRNDRQRREEIKSRTACIIYAPGATTTNAVTTRLSSPSGTSPFHPRRINWS